LRPATPRRPRASRPLLTAGPPWPPTPRDAGRTPKGTSQWACGASLGRIEFTESHHAAAGWHRRSSLGARRALEHSRPGPASRRWHRRTVERPWRSTCACPRSGRRANVWAVQSSRGRCWAPCSCLQPWRPALCQALHTAGRAAADGTADKRLTPAQASSCPCVPRAPEPPSGWAPPARPRIDHACRPLVPVRGKWSYAMATRLRYRRLARSPWAQNPRAIQAALRGTGINLRAVPRLCPSFAAGRGRRALSQFPARGEQGSTMHSAAAQPAVMRRVRSPSPFSARVRVQVLRRARVHSAGRCHAAGS
jgi:hypothetical protein